MNEYSKVCTLLSMLLYVDQLIDYGLQLYDEPSSVHVAVSTQIQHHWSNEKRDRSSQQHMISYAHIINHTFRLYKCTCANIIVGVAAQLQRENLSFKCTVKGSIIQKFFPALIVLYTYIKEYHTFCTRTIDSASEQNNKWQGIGIE